MKTNIAKENSIMKIQVSGIINTETAPEFEKEIMSKFDDFITSVVFDFSQLDYISSAGLRVLLLVCKKVGEDKKVTIRNAKPEVREVFEMTGFDSFLAIE